MCALRGKGQARARPAQCVTARHQQSDRQVAENKQSFIIHPATRVESRTGALTVGSGGYSVAFASGLSPAPLSRFQSPLSEPGRAVFPASRLSSGIMRLAHRSPLASVDDSHGFGTRPLLHPRPPPGVPPGLFDALTTPSLIRRPLHFLHVMLPESPILLPGFQAFATPGDPSPFGHRSSPEAPSLHRHYPASPVLRGLSAHPAGPASPSRGPGSVRASPPTGLPMLLPPSPSMRASVTTPAGPKRCPRRSLPPPSSAFPISQVGRPPHCPFRGLLDVHSRSGPHVR